MAKPWKKKAAPPPPSLPLIAPPPSALLLLLPLSAAPFLVSYFSSPHSFLLNWDDDGNYVYNSRIHTLSLPNIVWYFTSANIYFVYEPLSLLVKALQHQLVGLTPASIYLTNVALHLVVTALAYTLSLRLSPPTSAVHRSALFLGTLCFSAHPLRAEVVSWLSCQPYLLATTFSLLYLHASLPSHPTSPQRLLQLVLYIAATLFKSITIPLLTLPLIYHAHQAPNIYRVAPTRLLHHSPQIIAAVLLAAKQLHGNAVDGYTRTTDLTRAQSAQSTLASVGWYGKRVFGQILPAATDANPVAGFYPDQTVYTGVATATSAAGLGLLLVPLLLLLTHPYTTNRTHRGLLAGSWTVVCLLSPCFVAQHGWDMVGGNRYTYLASAVVLPVGVGEVGRRMQPTWVLRAGLLGLMVGVIGWNGIATKRACDDWGSSVSFWSSLNAAYPTINGPFGEVIGGNLARALLQVGDFEAAIKAAKLGFERNGEEKGGVSGVALATIYYDVGVAFKNEGEMSYAVESYQYAVEHNGAYVKALVNLGNCFNEMGRLDTAAEYLEMAAGIEKSAVVLFNLGNVYLKGGEGRKALVAYEMSKAELGKQGRDADMRMYGVVEGMIERAKKQATVKVS